ncbi:MAG: 16S rRNA (cytosine(967)-C(5))-methyltransferase RsmB [Eubacteriales bacterium]
MTSGINTREIVLEMLLEVRSNNIFSHQMIKNVLDKYDYLEVQEKRFMKRLFEGTIERMIELDYWISQYAKVKNNKMKPVIRTILQMSIYQILYMDAVPDSAVCNEAVKLTKKKKYHQLNGFVNGVLRTIVRERDTLVYPDESKDPCVALSVRYSMPQWLVETWCDTYGLEVTKVMLEDLLAEHSVTVRLDETLTQQEVEKVIKEWESHKIDMRKHTYLSYAYALGNVEGLSKLTYFQKGLYTVQDVSSMLVAEVAQVMADDKVLDLCAAPGGKSLHLATKLKRLKGNGWVEARDVSQGKVAIIEENKGRLQVLNLTTKIADARVLEEELIEAMDVVVADVPCSGLGVIGKKRDIKYRVTKESMESLVILQQEIVATAMQYVKIGGTLLYSTCTIHRGENEEIVEWMVSSGEYVLESLDPYLPECLHSESTKKGYLQLLPGIHECDGFFIARLRRIEKGQTSGTDT